MSELIEIISQENKLLDFMDRYHLVGLREATEEQLKEYIEEVLSNEKRASNKHSKRVRYGKFYGQRNETDGH